MEKRSKPERPDAGDVDDDEVIGIKEFITPVVVVLATDVTGTRDVAMFS